MIKGRFAPSPSGRMHLGNVYAALMSWLSVKSRGGSWVLRIEDLDPQRSKRIHAEAIEDDLRWLGLHWDEGGLDGRGPSPSYLQSERGHLYELALNELVATGFVYPCRCTRAEIMASSAPHQSDGRVIYSGRCRPQSLPLPARMVEPGVALRLAVPDSIIAFDDLIAGGQQFNLADECGDFIVRRADGVWAYQLAVVVDDASMGINEVMRGGDLLLSAAQQSYLYGLLGLTPPQFAHLPLLCNVDGQRLSKRDKSLSMEELRCRFTPEDLLGLLGAASGLIDHDGEATLEQLLEAFDLRKLPKKDSITIKFA